MTIPEWILTNRGKLWLITEKGFLMTKLTVQEAVYISVFDAGVNSPKVKLM